MLSTRNLICSTNSSSVTLWSFAEVLFDQYVVPSLLITMYFAPLILYASLISWPMLPRSTSCGMFVYRVEKSKLSKCLAFFCPIKLFQFFKDFRGIVDNPKTIDACVPGDAFAVLFKMIGNYF